MKLALIWLRRILKNFSLGKGGAETTAY